MRLTVSKTGYNSHKTLEKTWLELVVCYFEQTFTETKISDDDDD